MGKGGRGLPVAKVEEVTLAAWLIGKNQIEIKPLILPPLGPNDVKIRVKAVGICGSDVHYLKTMTCGDFVVEEPMVIGHECAGIVEQVGSGVTSLAVGNRVAVEPATPPTHGALANKIVHPAHLCFKLPENVSLEEGAMCEPLSVGVYACRRANVGIETGALIMGAGPIGLVTMLAARAFGAPRIVIVDVDSHRLGVAKKLGADAVVQVSVDMQDVDDEVAKIQNALGGGGADVTFDCVAFSKTMSTALKSTRSGGKVCVVGMGHQEMTIPLIPADAREVDVIGRYKNTWPLCLELLRTGKINVKPLITHRFGFSQTEIEKAFETSSRGRDAIKVMINETKLHRD